MRFERAITPKITIGDQPTEADLARLKAEGYTGIVNLRNDGEPEQPIDTITEGAKVRDLGMEYHHLGVGGTPLSAPGVQGVCGFIAKQDKVMVHCRGGGRAAGLVLIQQAQAQGWTPDEAVDNGRAIGLEVSGGLRAIVEGYLAANKS